MKKPTQTERIADILIKEGKIDNFTTIQNRLSLRLGARIWELRNRGWEIRTEEQEDKNTVYHLISKPPLETVGDALKIIDDEKIRWDHSNPTHLVLPDNLFQDVLSFAKANGFDYADRAIKNGVSVVDDSSQRM